MDAAWAADAEPADEFERLVKKNSRRTQAEQESARGRRLPTGLLVARFIRFYGMSAWLNASYPTRDHHVPFRLFYPMLTAMPNVSAAEQLSHYFSALLAGAMVHGGDEGKSQRERYVDGLLAEAYPDVGPPAPKPPLIEVVAR